MKTQTITKETIDRIVREELGKAMKDVESVKADEVEADELADTLEKKIDIMKAMKVEETRILKRLRQIRETRENLKRELLKNLL